MLKENKKILKEKIYSSLKDGLLNEDAQTFASSIMSDVLNSGKINLLYHNGLRKQFYFNRDNVNNTERREIEKEIKEELRNVFKDYVKIETYPGEVQVYTEKQPILRINVKLGRDSIPFIQYNFTKPTIKSKLSNYATVDDIVKIIERDKPLFKKNGLKEIFK